METLSKDVLGGKYFHMCYVVHILNLVVKYCLNEIDIFIRQVRESGKWLKNSPHRLVCGKKYWIIKETKLIARRYCALMFLLSGILYI